MRHLWLFLVFIAANGIIVGQEFHSSWESEPDRIWIGADFWANRLQDWQLKDGRLECVAKKNQPMRTVHLLTHRLDAESDDFEITVKLGPILSAGKPIDSQSERGFLLGAGEGKIDFRAAALVHQWAGPGAGIFVGVDGAGNPFLRDFSRKPNTNSTQSIDAAPEEVTLRVSAKMEGDRAVLKVVAGENGMETELPRERLVGNIALVSNATPGKGQHAWFSHLSVSGKGILIDHSAAFGPIACTQYTLSADVMKMTAQLMPIGDAESHTAFLEAQKDGVWTQIGEAEIEVPGWTATFRIANWDSTQDTFYRVVYGDDTWTGIVRKDPIDEETIVVAGFTGNHNNSHTVGAKNALTDWQTGMWFPHVDLTSKVRKHDPDVLFFSGDQVYESKSPTFADRSNIQLDYLYKWYLWCWAYRDLTRDIPTVTIPDDHDVYQGNIWGEGGRPIHVDNAGGYVHPADFVKMVHRTQVNHLPDPYDPEPIEQGIPVYFTTLNYGRVSFAILEDRKFKSGCADHGLPPSGTGRPDHFNNPDFDTRQLDLPGLELLGERQHAFLDAWVEDWKQADFKVALSQTIFANMATHHGANLDYLIADLDSNGWPQTQRNRAIDALRKTFAFHIAGDQHLGSIVHHGIENHEDGIWSFCVPSIANFYPRMWNPRTQGRNLPPGAPHWKGRHLDGFKNAVTVFAATNPGSDFGIEPKELHNKMPGYGIVRLKKTTREIIMECWPRSADPADPHAKQYPGWPMTIQQTDNYKRKAAGYLNPIQVDGMTNPVVQIRESATQKLVYAIRLKENKFTPWVFAPGRYDVRIGDPDSGLWTELKGVVATVDPYSEARLIEF